ncbi:unnamed protein product, partial [Gongylonema pulchrum]|uniref:Myosin motor domain-containing protein n=1 Tax=Gongylonema pulchrum TaxID=637853 RepID=A0A183EAS9_9BILA
MSGDNTIEDDIIIPAVFLYNKEGLTFMEHLLHYPNALVRLSDRPANPAYLFEKFIVEGQYSYPTRKMDLLEIVEENVEQMQKLYSAPTLAETVTFYNVIRQVAYWQLGLNTKPTQSSIRKFLVS